MLLVRLFLSAGGHIYQITIIRQLGFSSSCLQQLGPSPKNWPLPRKWKLFSGWVQPESCSPTGCTSDMPHWKKLRFQNKKLTFGTKYQNLPQNSHFGPKICIFGDMRANWLWPVGCFYNRASTYFITNYLKQCSTFLDTLAFGKCGKASLRIAAILSVFLRPAGSSNTNLNTKINFWTWYQNWLLKTRELARHL